MREHSGPESSEPGRDEAWSRDRAYPCVIRFVQLSHGQLAPMCHNSPRKIVEAMRSPVMSALILDSKRHRPTKRKKR